jgi:DNA segregation ATPase FtsK/SpoIIIE, S-DNA-T family
VNKNQYYWSKLKHWLFAEDDEPQDIKENPQKAEKLETKAEKPKQIKPDYHPSASPAAPEMEEVRMRHYYPQHIEKQQRPVKRKTTVPSVSSKGGNAAGRKAAPEKNNTVPTVKKKRPSAYGPGPFRAQEVPSPTLGMKLERERREKYAAGLADSRREAEEEKAEAVERKLLREEENKQELKTDKEPETLSGRQGGRPADPVEKVEVVEREENILPVKEEIKEEHAAMFSSEIPLPQEKSGRDKALPEKTDSFKPETNSGNVQNLQPEKRREKGKTDKNRTAPLPERKKPAAEKENNPKPFNVMMTPSDRARFKKAARKQQSGYTFPELNLLDVPPQIDNKQDEWAKGMSAKLDETLSYFRVQAEVVTYTSGPSVTRFEIQPQPGVKINKIVQLTDDLKRSLAATEIRIEAPIPGKTTVGIEVPNPSPTPVMLRAVLRDKNFRDASSSLTVALGVDISGEAIVTDITSMPHGLIAGTTGSGKSVCVNSMLTSILYKSTPEEVRMLLIDPKMVELAPFNRVPHLAAPVITDTKEATAALNWAVEEMERRYQLFAEAGARDLDRYNKKAETKLPKLLIVVDELADLMMVAPQEVEDAICRIAQKARACGIHLLVATQRPSVDVITGLIKANIPSRIAFSVSSQADSRTILDSGGAERLLGRGDMLFHPNSSPKPTRIQGTFVTDDEIDRVIDHVSLSEKPAPLFDPAELKEAAAAAPSPEDELFDEAVQFVMEKQTASTSLLQRHFQVGYNRAARIIDDLEAHGIVSPAKGSKPRDVYTKVDSTT